MHFIKSICFVLLALTLYSNNAFANEDVTTITPHPLHDGSYTETNENIKTLTPYGLSILAEFFAFMNFDKNGAVGVEAVGKNNEKTFIFNTGFGIDKAVFISEYLHTLMETSEDGWTDEDANTVWLTLAQTGDAFLDDWAVNHADFAIQTAKARSDEALVDGEDQEAASGDYNISMRSVEIKDDAVGWFLKSQPVYLRYFDECQCYYNPDTYESFLTKTETNQGQTIPWDNDEKMDTKKIGPHYFGAVLENLDKAIKDHKLGNVTITERSGERAYIHDGRVYKYRNSNSRVDAFALDGEIEDLSDGAKAHLWATASATNGELTSILQLLKNNNLNKFIANTPGELCLSGGLQLCSDLFGPK